MVIFYFLTLVTVNLKIIDIGIISELLFNLGMKKMGFHANLRGANVILVSSWLLLHLNTLAYKPLSLSKCVFGNSI